MRRFLLVACCALLAVVAGEAKKKHRGGVFAPSERQAIGDYYRAQPQGLPPGLAKRGGNLPPGLEKKLRRDGRLPPGLDKRVTHFPLDLERRLPALPVGVRRGILGDRAVMYDSRTLAILDAFGLR